VLLNRLWKSNILGACAVSVDVDLADVWHQVLLTNAVYVVVQVVWVSLGRYLTFTVLAVLSQVHRLLGSLRHFVSVFVAVDLDVHFSVFIKLLRFTTFSVLRCSDHFDIQILLAFLGLQNACWTRYNIIIVFIRDRLLFFATRGPGLVMIDELWFQVILTVVDASTRNQTLPCPRLGRGLVLCLMMIHLLIPAHILMIDFQLLGNINLVDLFFLLLHDFGLFHLF
jgi:hypothetical protein